MSRSALTGSSDVLPSYFDRSSILSQSSPPSYSGHQEGLPTAPVFAYVSRRLVVTLDTQRGGAPYATYSSEGNVEGSVQVVSWDHAESLVVTLEGTLRAITMKQSIPNVTRTIKFVSRIMFLPVTSGNSDAGPSRFSFRLPIRDDSGTAPIPPTFYAASADLQVEVMYSLSVTLTRRGLHKDESLIIPFRYLPRSSVSSGLEEITSQSQRFARLLQNSSHGRIQIEFASSSPQAESSEFIVAVNSDASDLPIVTAKVNKQIVVVQHGQKFQATRELFRPAISTTRSERSCWEAKGCLRFASDASDQSWSFGGVTVLHVLRIQAQCKINGRLETYVHSQPLLEPAPALLRNRDTGAVAPGH